MIQGINAIITIVSLCCYLFVIYQMFNNAESVMGIVCLVGICLLGLGTIVAFIYGWIKAWEWEIVPVMGVWSCCVVAQLILLAVQVMMGTP